MGKKNSNQENQYVCKKSYENSFISDVISTYNSFSSSDLELQKNAMKNAIVHIKDAYAHGKSEEEIQEMLLNNMNNLFSSIKSPDLVNFYQLRTLEYMMDLDLEPYVEEILTSDINILKYEDENRYNYSADINSNVKIELCGLIRDFIEAQKFTSNAEFNILCERLKRNIQNISDKNLMLKYVNLYLKGIQIGKLGFWEEQRKNLEECRKMLYKYRDKLIKIEDIGGSSNTLKNQTTMNNNILSSASVMPQDIKEKTQAIVDEFNKSKTNGKSISTIALNPVKPYRSASLKLVEKIPFISNNKVDNFLLIMTEALANFESDTLRGIYDMIVFSERGDTKVSKEAAKNIVYNLFTRIVFKKNLLHAREHLMERIDSLIKFYMASGCLTQYCDVNNSKLHRIYLDDLKIKDSELYSKFLNNDDVANQYFVNVDEKIYDENYKGTSMGFSSDEAIVGMSAFYANRMTKQMLHFSSLAYIFDKKNVIKRLGKRPDLEFEDLGYTDDDICLYMAMYRCFQKLMIRYYLQNLSSNELQYNEKVHDSLTKILEKYKGVYEGYFPNMGFDFSSDIDLVMRDALLIQDIYDIKSFSVKSLLYTAITDKKKNMINWGVVPEDENEDDKFVLLGFDIKSLNAPLFVHMKRDELITFLNELTGGSKLRVYEGANDMYSYSIKQRVTTQILYPLSKEEKKKLLKLEGTGALTDYYKHIRWLQQSNNPPSLSHVPGSRVYDFSTKKIERIKQSSSPKVIKKKNNGDYGDR